MSVQAGSAFLGAAIGKIASPGGSRVRDRPVDLVNYPSLTCCQVDHCPRLYNDTPAASGFLWELLGSAIVAFLCMTTTCRRQTSLTAPLAVGVGITSLKVLIATGIACHPS